MKKTFLFLFLLSFLPLASFFKADLPVTHDGPDHVVRLASFYRSLMEGSIIPRWAGNLNWGYGHPVLMFFYPLPNYLGSLFHFLGFSFINSVKAVFVLSFVLSGIFMYLWIKDWWGEKSGLVAGFLWLFAPYRFVDLYVRGAIGECLAFVWPPLICWSLWRLFQKIHWQYLTVGSLALAALILSHNALSLMFLPIIFGYMMYLIFISKKKLLFTVYCLLLTIFGFSLSAFFWLPAFFEAKYTLMEIVMAGSFTGFESLARLFWSPWNFGGDGSFSVQIGFLQWFLVLLGPYLIWWSWHRNEKKWLWLSFIWFIFILAVFLILPLSEFVYQKISLLQRFQFAWRFLALAIFPPVILGGFWVFIFPKKHQDWLVAVILLVGLFFTKDYWQTKGFLSQTDSFYLQNQANTTNDTGESAPRWSIRRMEEFPRAPMEIISGKAEVKVLRRTNTRHDYQIKAETKTRLVENTLYFPGWEVLNDGKKIPIEFQNPEFRGLMTFEVPVGQHEVVVAFGETKLRRVANVISLLGLSILLIRWLIK